VIAIISVGNGCEWNAPLQITALELVAEYVEHSLQLFGLVLFFDLGFSFGFVFS